MLPGYRKVLIYPEASKGLSFVSFSYDTMFGKLQVKWEKAENGFCYQLVIPHGMTRRSKGRKGEAGNRKRGMVIYTFIIHLHYRRELCQNRIAV